jgi:hypothetical protein
MKSFLLALTALGLAACSPDTTSPLDDVREPGFLYSLRSVNGSPVPASLPLANGGSLVFRSGETVLRGDGTMRDALSWDFIYPPNPNFGTQEARMQEGRWRPVDGGIVLTLSDGTTMSASWPGGSLRATRTLVVSTLGPDVELALTFVWEIVP